MSVPPLMLVGTRIATSPPAAALANGTLGHADELLAHLWNLDQIAAVGTLRPLYQC